jgi:hypothetical protein
MLPAGSCTQGSIAMHAAQLHSLPGSACTGSDECQAKGRMIPHALGCGLAKTLARLQQHVWPGCWASDGEYPVASAGMQQVQQVYSWMCVGVYCKERARQLIDARPGAAPAVTQDSPRTTGLPWCQGIQWRCTSPLYPSVTDVWIQHTMHAWSKGSKGCMQQRRSIGRAPYAHHWSEPASAHRRKPWERVHSNMSSLVLCAHGMACAQQGRALNASRPDYQDQGHTSPSCPHH